MKGKTFLQPPLVCIWLMLLSYFCKAQNNDSTEEQIAEIKAKLDKQDSILNTLGRQLMLQQFYNEEQTRSNGDSGIKAIRLANVGPRPYYADSHSTLNAIAGVHTHANNIRTVGMGEVIAVLNGVEFRTRHNDYRLYMPNTTSNAYNAVEDIPFPEVPDTVAQLENVTEQVLEMREYFRAFRDQNETHRPYKQYFKPIICYLEGAWTTSTDEIEESFESDRHNLDADSWLDMQEKIRFTSATGTKDSLENFAYLPTTIVNVTEDNVPILAQWNYRILCHPIKRDLPTNRFRVVDDLGTRTEIASNIFEFTTRKTGKFQLNPYDSDEWKTAIQYPERQLIDMIMEEVPGKDNYGADIIDDSFGQTAYLYTGDDTIPKNEEPLNVGFYHRVYKNDGRDAMGVQLRRRGYNDQNLFMAATTHPQIAPASVNYCRKKTCTEYVQRWSYAVPLEIIYLNPLSSWNPYDMEYKGDYKSDYAKTVAADGRNGDNDVNKAYNGTHSKLYFITPAEFYGGEDTEVSKADTFVGAKYGLDREGNLRRLFASGTRVIIPTITGIGPIRQRYPIMPLHGEGQTVFKNLEALIDIVMEPKKFRHMFRGNYDRDAFSTTFFTLKMAMSESDEIEPHEHWVHLNFEDLELLYAGEQLEKYSTYYGTHHHHLLIRKKAEDKITYFRMLKCDWKTNCPHHKHDKDLLVDNMDEPYWSSDTAPENETEAGR